MFETNNESFEYDENILTDDEDENLPSSFKNKGENSIHVF